MTNDIFRNNSLEIMRIPSNCNLKNINDDVLVSLAQDDIDIFRQSCTWECNLCDKKISYKDSLNKLNEKYIHELKCSDINHTKCKSLMALKHKNDVNLNSLYFDELLARYQDRMIAEAMKCKGIEDPYEVYSILMGFFMKIVGKFAREKSFSKTSEKWFSTYFWVSIRNKTTDIRKTNNYIKRSPFIRCEVCNKDVGQINSRHLLEDGHEVLLDKVKYNIGNGLICESGEINYYKGATNDEFKIRCIKIGDDFISFLDNKIKKDFVSKELYKTYKEEYPNYSMKNAISSINETIGFDDSDKTEVGDSFSTDKSMFHSDKIEVDRNLLDLVNVLLEKSIMPNINKISLYFHEGVKDYRKIEIIKNIIIDKSSYNKLSDKEIDLDYKSEAKKGLTSAIFKTIASNNQIKEELKLQEAD